MDTEGEQELLGNQALLDYVAGLEAALKDVNQAIWFAVQAAGGMVRISLDTLAAFDPAACTLERVEDRGSVTFISRQKVADA